MRKVDGVLVEIECLRSKLNQNVYQKGINHPDVIHLSQQLDQQIYTIQKLSSENNNNLVDPVIKLL